VVVGEGSSKAISHFKNKHATMNGQRYSSEILLFMENSQYCVLKLKAGLVCDGPLRTGRMNLFKHDSIYFPDETYFNSNEFPKEWM
jgi:hypothetical protein